MARSAAEGVIGKRLGAYFVEELLGEGAMGAVYVATDLHLGREVALKLVHASLLSDTLYCERFLREARAAARLNHPNIVQVYAAGTEDGIPFIALELVRGGSLAHYLARAGGTLPPRRACEIARDAACGLGAAHAEGIVHRDVKPDNMLLSEPQGQLKLTDFGIARVAAMSARITQSGYFVGTPRYASPEQCHAEELDGRSDLYSLGVCLYELLAGDAPFDAPTPLALLQQICQEPPRPLREVRPEVPERVARLVARLMEKERDARYAGAADLTADLEAAIAELPEAEIKLAEAPARKRRGSRPEGEGAPVAQGAYGGTGAPAAAAAQTVRRSPPLRIGGEREFTDGTTPIALNRSDQRWKAAERLEMMQRLAEAGKPVAALRALALFARSPQARQADPRALYAPLAGIVQGLRERGTRFRPVPSLVDAVEALAKLDVSLAMLAGDLADIVDERKAALATAAGARVAALAPAPSGEGRRSAGGRSALHVEAVVHLAELGTGLPLAWKWDELAGAYDDAVVPLDPDGRQQVQAAATVLAGLVAPEEQPALREFNERRRVVPVISLRNVGSILGTSAGLPTFLAMVAARFGLVPKRGVAATGTIDGASVPPLPPGGRLARPGSSARFLGVEIGRVEAVREKVQAVVEQSPDVEVLILPAANAAEVHADAALLRDIEAAGLRLLYVATIEDALSADLFSPEIALRPLRLAAPPAPAGAPGAAGEAGGEGEVAAALRLAEVGAGAAAAFAALAVLIASGAG